MMSWSAIWLTIAFYFSLSKCTHWGSKASSKNKPIIIFYRVQQQQQQRQLASQCRKNVEKSFMQIYVSWRVCVVQSGAAGGLVDFQNGSIMLFSCPLAEKARRWRGSNECIFQHELGGITHTSTHSTFMYGWDFLPYFSHEFEYSQVPPTFSTIHQSLRRLKSTWIFVCLKSSKATLHQNSGRLLYKTGSLLP